MDSTDPLPAGSCRTDNGRCFARGGWDAATQLATVQFSDDSIYRFGPIEESDWVNTFQLFIQPGCTWNFQWKDSPPTHWEHLFSWPSGLIHTF